MLIHVHGCICLLLLECQTTGRTPESQAESMVSLSATLHNAAAIALFYCIFIFSIVHIRKDGNWMCCGGLTDLISLCSSTRLVYCSWSLFLKTSTHECSVGFVALTTAHLHNMGKDPMTRNVTGFNLKKKKRNKCKPNLNTRRNDCLAEEQKEYCAFESEQEEMCFPC